MTGCTPGCSGGIIPACAGNTRRSCHNRGRGRDHPRMRGEHLMLAAGALSVMGSSPHARGTREQGARLAAWHGIIPACAGNTDKTRPRPAHGGDHPRMRGEHYGDIPVTLKPVGSSPHARGTLIYHFLFSLSYGIIPACAGNTLIKILVLDSKRDHPRMRGEHHLALETALGGLGSSPHARGTHS